MPNAVHVFAERRASPRFAVDQRVDIQTGDGIWRIARLLDVSIDGARISLFEPCSQGTLRLRLPAPTGEIGILARVIRSTGDGVAIEYVEMTIEALTRYSRWLDSLVALVEPAGAVRDSS